MPRCDEDGDEHGRRGGYHPVPVSYESLIPQMLKDELEFEISPVLGDKLTTLRNRYRATGAHADNIRYGWVRKRG